MATEVGLYHSCYLSMKPQLNIYFLLTKMVELGRTPAQVDLLWQQWPILQNDLTSSKLLRSEISKPLNNCESFSWSPVWHLGSNFSETPRIHLCLSTNEYSSYTALVNKTKKKIKSVSESWAWPASITANKISGHFLSSDLCPFVLFHLQKKIISVYKNWWSIWSPQILLFIGLIQAQVKYCLLGTQLGWCPAKKSLSHFFYLMLSVVVTYDHFQSCLIHQAVFIPRRD